MNEFNMTEDDQDKALAVINGWLAKRPAVRGWYRDEADLWRDVFREVNPLCPVFPLAFMKWHILRIGYSVEHRAKFGYRIDLSNTELLDG